MHPKTALKQCSFKNPEQTKYIYIYIYIYILCPHCKSACSWVLCWFTWDLTRIPETRTRLLPTSTCHWSGKTFEMEGLTQTQNQNNQPMNINNVRKSNQHPKHQYRKHVSAKWPDVNKLPTWLHKCHQHGTISHRKTARSKPDWCRETKTHHWDTLATWKETKEQNHNETNRKSTWQKQTTQWKQSTSNVNDNLEQHKNQDKKEINITTWLSANTCGTYNPPMPPAHTRNVYVPHIHASAHTRTYPGTYTRHIHTTQLIPTTL